MDRKTTSAPTRAYLQTNVHCTDPAIGRLRLIYLENALTASEMAIFRRHLLGCLACASDVTNAKTMAAASTEAVVDDVELTACLEPVQIIEPSCRNWRQLAAALMTFRK